MKQHHPFDVRPARPKCRIARDDNSKHTQAEALSYPSSAKVRLEPFLPRAHFRMETSLSGSQASETGAQESASPSYPSLLATFDRQT